MERNRGIDLLRIIAMVFVASLHIIGIGGIINGSELLSGNFLLAQLLRIAMLCAVDCYGLISGFVGWDRKPKLSALATLWLKAVCYCAVITALTARLVPGSVDRKTVWNVFLPITTGQYWYLTAYVGLFVLQPILNHAVRTMAKKDLGRTLAAVLVLFSLLPISPLTDAFYLHDGYSVLWLCVIYLLGGYLGKYGLPRLSTLKWIGIYGFCILFAWAPRMIALFWKPHLWYDAYGNILIEYTSPTIVLAAVALLAVFSRMKVPACVSGLSGFAFGAYLLHAHPLVFRYLLTDRFSHLGSGSMGAMLLTLFPAALAITAAGMAADALLTSLFRLLRISKLLKRLDRFS